MAPDHPKAIGHYQPWQVARLAGVSTRRLGQWVRYGVVPSISRSPRIYSYADAGEAILAHYLIDQIGLRPSRIGEIVERLREKYGQWPLATAPLAVDRDRESDKRGGLVVVVEEDQVFDVSEVPEHKLLAATLVNLTEVGKALRQGGWVAYERPRPLIEVDPGRHSGAPVVKGRRLPTRMVAELAGTPEGRRVLRGEYGLRDEEIDAAAEYERDVDAVAA